MIRRTTGRNQDAFMRLKNTSNVFEYPLRKIGVQERLPMFGAEDQVVMQAGK